MSKFDIKISLALKEGKAPKDCTKAELSIAMDGELSGFNKHMQSLGQDPLVRSESALIKTYLAWKILHAPDDNGTQD